MRSRSPSWRVAGSASSTIWSTAFAKAMLRRCLPPLSFTSDATRSRRRMPRWGRPGFRYAAMTDDRLTRLTETIRARRAADANASYVAKLFAKGRERMAQKLGEEAIETVIAAAQGNADAVKGEAADLLFHLAVLL